MINKKLIDYDFERNIWCILGLPFDVISFKDCLNIIKLNIKKDNKIVFSTSNVD